MLSHFNVEIGARCSRAVHGGARSRLVGCLPCRPKYRHTLTIVGGVRGSSLSKSIDTKIDRCHENVPATGQHNAATVRDVSGSNCSKAVWYLSRGVTQ
jgi:hypothetical protein